MSCVVSSRISGKTLHVSSIGSSLFTVNVRPVVVDPVSGFRYENVTASTTGLTVTVNTYRTPSMPGCSILSATIVVVPTPTALTMALVDSSELATVTMLVSEDDHLTPFSAVFDGTYSTPIATTSPFWMIRTSSSPSGLYGLNPVSSPPRLTRPRAALMPG